MTSSEWRKLRVSKHFVGSVFFFFSSSKEKKWLQPLAFNYLQNMLLIFVRFLMPFFLLWTNLVAPKGRFIELNSVPLLTQTSAMPWIIWENPIAMKLCQWMPARSWTLELAVHLQGDSTDYRRFCERFSNTALSTKYALKL